MHQYIDLVIIPNGGGVTESGSEAIFQAEFVTEWFKAYRAEGIGTCLDTNSYARNIDHTIDALMEQTDLVMLDLKQVNGSNFNHLVFHTAEAKCLLARISHFANTVGKVILSQQDFIRH